MRPEADGCTCFDETTRSCPIHGTRVDRFVAALKRPSTPLITTPCWQEVTAALVEENGICFLAGELPTIFVVRGSQMYKLVWPQLPPIDPKKTALR